MTRKSLGLAVLFVLPTFLMGSERPAFAGDIAGTITEQGTGTPLEGIDIDVFDTAYQAVVTDASSDANGDYSVTGLPAGDYVIRADPSVGEGYVAQYNSGAFLRSDAPFLTVPAAGTSTVDFSLLPGALVGGRVTIEGSAVAAEGIDIDVFTSAGKFVETVNARTDTSGDYEIGALPPGSYFIRADPDSTSFLVERFYPNAESRDQATPVVIVGTADRDGIDFSLPKGGLIQGVVRGAGTATPLASVDIDVFDSAGIFQRAGGITSATGAYRVGPFLPGDYFIRADPTPASGVVATYHPDQLFEASATRVTVSADTTAVGADISAPQGGTLSGTIREEGLMTALAGIDLDVFDIVGTRIPVNAKTDLSGMFTLGAMPAGSYRVRADPTLRQGYAPEFYGGAIFESSGTVVTVQVGADRPGVDFLLIPGAVLEGTIRETGSNVPLAAIDLDLFDPSGKFYSTAGGSTSATGFYRIGPLPPGMWVLQADSTLAQGYADEYYDGELAFARAARLDLAPDEVRTGLDFFLDPGGFIAGTVRLAANNAPFAGSDLDVFFPDGRRVDDNGLTDASGNYSVGPFPAGDYVVRADPPGVSGLAEKYYDDVYDPTSAARISIVSGNTTGAIDFLLDAGPVATPTPTSTGGPPLATNTPTESPVQTGVPTSTYSSTPTATSSSTPGGSPTVTPTPSSTSNGPTPTLGADTNGDFLVNAEDLLKLLQQWKNGGPNPLESADFTGEGNIDASDLHVLALQWKTGP